MTRRRGPPSRPWAAPSCHPARQRPVGLHFERRSRRLTRLRVSRRDHRNHTERQQTAADDLLIIGVIAATQSSRSTAAHKPCSTATPIANTNNTCD